MAVSRRTSSTKAAETITRWIQRSLSALIAPSLPIARDHAAAVAGLEPIHRDPFDRVLIAQALHEPALLLTADRALEPYGEVVHVIR